MNAGGVCDVLLQHDDNRAAHTFVLFLKKKIYTLFHYWKGSFWNHFVLETFWGLCFNCPVVSLHRSWSLVFIIGVRGSNWRIMWWSLFLHKFNIKICHIRGWENVLADALYFFSEHWGCDGDCKGEIWCFMLLHQSRPLLLHLLFCWM